MKPVNAIRAATIAAHICGTSIRPERSSPRASTTIHNLFFYLRLMADLRAAISEGRLREFAANFRARPPQSEAASV